jgi:hypothetical protein
MALLNYFCEFSMQTQQELGDFRENGNVWTIFANGPIKGGGVVMTLFGLGWATAYVVNFHENIGIFL